MPHSPHLLVELVRRMGQARVLVLGDVVADEHIVGGTPAVAREAPILVLQERERYILPGGATNVAYNARALGAQVYVCGVVGADATGEALRTRLVETGMDVTGLVVDPRRPTTTKSRIWAGGAQQQVQQLVLRIDRVDRRSVDGDVSGAMLDRLHRQLPEVDALIISDYENGVIHPAVIEVALPLARSLGKLVAVDSHGDLFRFRGATVVTPNQPEAEATLGRTLRTLAEVEAAGAELRERLAAQAVLMTRGSEGMSLFTPSGVDHFPAVATAPVVDPTGAGDTVAAVFTLAAATGATMQEAALLASYAAAVVVGKIGAATASQSELEAALTSGGSPGRATDTR